MTALGDNAADPLAGLDESDFRPGLDRMAGLWALGVGLELADDIDLDLEAIDLANRAIALAQRKRSGDADPDLCVPGP